MMDEYTVKYITDYATKQASKLRLQVLLADNVIDQLQFTARESTLHSLCAWIHRSFADEMSAEIKRLESAID